VLVFACCIGELGDLIAFRDTRARSSRLTLDQQGNETASYG
jgi:hypothetical protein